MRSILVGNAGWQECKAPGRLASPHQKAKRCWPQPAFSFWCSLGPQSLGWPFLHLGRVLPPQISQLEASLQSRPRLLSWVILDPSISSTSESVSVTWVVVSPSHQRSRAARQAEVSDQMVLADPLQSGFLLTHPVPASKANSADQCRRETAAFEEPGFRGDDKC